MPDSFNLEVVKNGRIGAPETNQEMTKQEEEQMLLLPTSYQSAPGETNYVPYSDETNSEIQAPSTDASPTPNRQPTRSASADFQNSIIYLTGLEGECPAQVQSLAWLIPHTITALAACLEQADAAIIFLRSTVDQQRPAILTLTTSLHDIRKKVGNPSPPTAFPSSSSAKKRQLLNN